MRRLVVRTVKYASIGIVLVAAVPILIPLVFLISFLGLAFVVPLGGTLAGFLFLRKYGRILFDKLPRASGIHREARRGRFAVTSRGDATLSNLSRTNVQNIETFDVDDPKFDAVVESSFVADAEVPSSDAANDSYETGAAAVPDETRDGAEHLMRKAAESDIFVEENSANSACLDGSSCTKGVESGDSTETSSDPTVTPFVEWDSSNAASQDRVSPAAVVKYKEVYLQSSGSVLAEGEKEDCPQTVDSQNWTNPSLANAFEEGEVLKERIVAEGEGRQEHWSGDSGIFVDERASTGTGDTDESSVTTGAHEAGETIREPNFEDVSDNLVHPADVFEEQERDDNNPPDAKVTGSCIAYRRGEADGASRLLPHQANEHDIWVCKECGWKYPNAKPSAKIRRNHKKNCKGNPSTAGYGVLSEGPSQSSLNTTSKDEIDTTRMNFREDLAEQRDGIVGNEERTYPVRGSSNLSANISTFENTANPSTSTLEESDRNNVPTSKSVAFNDSSISCEPSGFDTFVPQPSRSSVLSDSFHSAPDFAGGNSVGSNRCSLASEESTFDDQQDHPRSNRCSLAAGASTFDDQQNRLAQVLDELQLQEDLNAVKGIVGYQDTSTRPLVVELKELSENLGMDLPAMCDGVSEFEWAKVALELIKVVVGVEE